MSLTNIQKRRIYQLLKSRTYKESKQSLSKFIENAWHVLEPAKKYLHNWHTDYICEHLELARRGELNKIIINVPPGYMKSLNVTVCFPAWVWANSPDKRFISMSYSASLSTDHSIKRRNLIESEWFQEGWGDRVKFAPGENLKTFYTNTMKGFMYSTSVGGTLTGKHADFLIFDDPHNPKETESEVQRQRAIDFAISTASTRFTDKKKGVIIIVMQRLHEKDLTGYYLEEGGYTHLKLPAVCDEPQKLIFPISSRVVEREQGDLLWPEREDQSVIEDMKIRLGPYHFAGQYQQRPAPREGGMIKAGELKPLYAIPPYKYSIWYWDLAMKITKKGSYVAGMKMAAINGGYCILKVVRKKMTYVDTKSEILMQFNSDPTNAVLIEDKANGPAVLSDLQMERIPILADNPGGLGKESRLDLELPMVRAGKVFYLSGEPWEADFLNEALLFPNSADSDQVDCLSGCLRFFRTNKTMSVVESRHEHKTFAGSLNAKNSW